MRQGTGFSAYTAVTSSHRVVYEGVETLVTSRNVRQGTVSSAYTAVISSLLGYVLPIWEAEKEKISLQGQFFLLHCINQEEKTITV